MTKTKWLLTHSAVLAGLMILTVAASARAEGGLTLEERLERLERKGEQPAAACCDTSELQRRLDQIEAHIKNLPFGIKLGGGIATSYQYDFNDPTVRPDVAAGLRSATTTASCWISSSSRCRVPRVKTASAS